MADTITIKASKAAGNRVALWDVDDAHPDGEVYVAGQDAEPVEAAETPRVLEALRDGRVEKVSSGGSPVAREAAREGKSERAERSERGER